MFKVFRKNYVSTVLMLVASLLITGQVLAASNSSTVSKKYFKCVLHYKAVVKRDQKKIKTIKSTIHLRFKSINKITAIKHAEEKWTNHLEQSLLCKQASVTCTVTYSRHSECFLDSGS